MRLNQSKQKAGAIIVQKFESSVAVLLLFRAKYDDWTFPKGHIEIGEAAENAAKREVREETGLAVRTIMQLPSHSYTDNNGSPVNLSMYLVVPTNQSNLKRENKGDLLRWTPVDDVEQLLTHKNLREYFQKIKHAL